MDDEKLLTEWNSNIEVLKRINRYLDRCGELYINRDINLWYDMLVLLRRELWGRMIKKEKESCEVMFEILKRDILEYKINKKDHNEDNDFIELEHALLNKLDEMEMFLRKVYDENGLGLTDKVNDQGL